MTYHNVTGGVSGREITARISKKSSFVRWHDEAPVYTTNEALADILGTVGTALGVVALFVESGGAAPIISIIGASLSVGSTLFVYYNGVSSPKSDESVVTYHYTYDIQIDCPVDSDVGRISYQVEREEKFTYVCNSSDGNPKEQVTLRTDSPGFIDLPTIKWIRFGYYAYVGSVVF